MKYVEPKFLEKQFNCPYCQSFAHQIWFDGINGNEHGKSKGMSSNGVFIDNTIFLKDLHAAKCANCENYSLWKDEKMIYPFKSNVEDPNELMPENVKNDYIEASQIVVYSPRGACALLRLALDKLMDELEIPGDTLHKKILNYLDEDGIGSDLEHAFTAIRVIGNESVHIGVLDMKDNVEIAKGLFKILNFIVESTIGKSKRINDIYKIIPDNKKLK